MSRLERFQAEIETGKRPKPPEFVQTIVIGAEIIDGNGHVNNAEYLRLYQTQRNGLMKEFEISIDRENEGIAVLADFEGKFRSQVFEGETIDMHTSVARTRSSLVFFQRILRQGIEVADFRCTVAMIDKNGKPRRLSDRIAAKIDQGNARLLEKK